jgi:hypothetical protein
MWKRCGKYVNIYICILDYIRVSFYGNILVKHRFMRKPMKTQLFSIPYWKKICVQGTRRMQ